jgi:F-type H+-transporting ATPase subunit alpha
MREREVGFIVEAKQYVLTLEGLPSAGVNDVIVHEKGGRALVQSLAGDRLTALALDYHLPRAGDRYTYLPDNHLFSLGDHLFGRVINVLGEPVDGKGSFPPGNSVLELDAEAPGIESRVPIHEQFHTGFTVIDTILPVAKGQRQLLFGPVRGGKTDFLIDVVINQQRYGMVCIYAIIGKSLSELEHIQRMVLDPSVKGKNIIVAALSDQPSPRIMLAPAVAFLIANFFQRQGLDVLVILDDLDMHAKYLREIALLEERLPGRESYPGDLFYQQAHLLERTGQFGPALGGGSITAFPVIETDAYASLGIVSTNLMSCTDGHLSFLASLQAEGVYPAISEEQSITRIGHAAQSLLQKQLSSRLRGILEDARRERKFAEFGTQMSSNAEALLHQGDIVEHLLKQDIGVRIPAEVQVPLLSLALTPFILEKDLAFIDKNKARLAEGLMTNPLLTELTKPAFTEMPLDTYLPKLQAKQAVFESICQK